MRRTVKTIICILAAAAALVSCKKEEALRYNNVTMGNVVDGTFTSDYGNIFTVVEKNCTADLEKMKRAITLCDVLSKVEGTENVYNVRLNACQEVLTKNYVEKDTADADSEMSVEDPVNIQEMWISGGYLNLFINFEVNPNKNTKHLINLVLDEEASVEGSYTFLLRHNSFGDSFIHGAQETVFGGTYVSFPIADLIKENSAEITIRFEWYKGNLGQGLTSDTQEHVYKVIYNKGGYEQAPFTIASKAATNLN